MFVGGIERNVNQEIRFYVIEDLRKAAFPKHVFQELDEALGKFENLANESALTVLGVDCDSRTWELMQCVGGDNVLVHDYQMQDFNGLDDVRTVLDMASARLVDDSSVQWVYSQEYFDRVGKSCPVIVPLAKDDVGFDGGYCEGKRLKTVSGLGFDSINQLYVTGRGWVEYQDVREQPEVYAVDGVLPVEYVNVNYVLEGNFVGIDGQMDITAQDFSRMVSDVHKEYSLLVYDSLLGGDYIAGSFDSIGEAVREWYELPADVCGYVNRTVGNSYQQTVFNGIDDDLEDISYERAAHMYGFDSHSLDSTLSKAMAASRELRDVAQVAKRELDFCK